MKIFGYLKPEALELAAEYDYPVASEIYQFLSSKFDTYSWPWYHEFKELPLIINHIFIYNFLRNKRLRVKSQSCFKCVNLYSEAGF